MVSVPHANKHLIKFPVALEPTILKGNNMDSSYSTPSTVLLKADTGKDVNLMNRQTFHQLFGDSQVLKPTPIKMENYGNSAVKVLGMFHAFLRWKDKVYRQLFYVTDCDRSPNLLSRDACYILGVLKPCYTMEKTTTWKTTSNPTVNACAKADIVAKSFHHQKMNGSEEKTVQWFQQVFYFTDPTERSSIGQAGHSWCVLWCFYQDREVSRNAIQVPIEGKCKNSRDMHLGKFLYIYKMPFIVKSEIWKN